jgi:Flp pilus assembly protein TadB
MSTGDDVPSTAPPAGEEIHLPGPTILPMLVAMAITLIVIGTTISWILSIIGGIVLVVCIVRWVRDTRRDVAALPEEHH